MTTLLFLPDGAFPDATDHAGFRWMRFGDGGLLARGHGVPDGDDAIVAVVPADSVTLHWAELPARSPAQGLAAARLLAAEASAAPVGELHVAVGEPEDGGAERPIGVVGAGAMAGWLATLAQAGIDPTAMIPAPMLLPRPDAGYVRAEVAGRGVVRGRTSGFADEERLTEMVTGDDPPVQLDRTALDAALDEAARAPALDLRQGLFARRRRVTIDWALIRRLAVLALAILGVTLAISLVRLAKYSLAADAAEQRADALAATGLPRGETINDPDRQLAERLGRARGPGLGFTTTAAAAYAATRAVPGTELKALDFTADGAMRLTVSADREALAIDLLRALQRAGLTARASTFTAAGGRVTGELTVTPR